MKKLLDQAFFGTPYGLLIVQSRQQFICEMPRILLRIPIQRSIFLVSEKGTAGV